MVEAQKEKKTATLLSKQLVVDGRNFGEFSDDKTKRMLGLKGVKLIQVIVPKKKRSRSISPPVEPSLLENIPMLQPFTGNKREFSQ